MKYNQLSKILAVLTLLFTVSAFAEDAWIKRAAVLKADQGPAGDGTANVLKGAKVKVLERDGSWVKVDFNGQSGWVSADSVSSREVRPDTSLGGSSSAAEMSSGAAVRGLQPEAADYARDKHYSTKGLDQMVAIKKSVTNKMLKDFIAEGQIEPAKNSK